MQGTHVHIAVKTSKLKESVAFYEQLFGQAPLKNYDDYAKFELSTPGLNLTLNQVADAPLEQAIDHLGIEFGTREAVAEMIKGLREADIPHEVQNETTCCYGVQDKAWVKDPNGIRWELYSIIVADNGSQSCSLLEQPEPVAVAAEGSCCGPSQCC